MTTSLVQSLRASTNPCHSSVALRESTPSKDEDAEKAVAGVIEALFKTLQQKENTIRPLSTTATERREEILAANNGKITKAIKILTSFIDNQGDLAELSAEEDNETV